MITNYKQLLNDLGLIAMNHNQIMSFGYGDLSQITNDIETHLEPLYVRMYIVPGSTIFNQGSIQYNLSIIICDRVEDDLSNQVDILSDTLEIAKDIFTILHNSYGDEFGNFTEYYEPQFGSSVVPFLERFDTILGGWTLNISISQPYDYNDCIVPVVWSNEPTDTSNVTYKQMSLDLVEIGITHKQLNSVGIGDIPQLTNDINTKVAPLYPKMYIVPSDVTLSENELFYNFNILVVDKLKVDYSNQRDIMNDTLEICKDIFSTLEDSEYNCQFGVTCQPILEEYDDILGGWTMSVQLITTFGYNRCDVPVDRFDHKKWYQLDELWNKISKLWKNV